MRRMLLPLSAAGAAAASCPLLLRCASGCAQAHRPPACSCFGQLALLYNAPRAATVRAEAPCRLWAMDRAVLNAIKRAHAERLEAEKLALLDQMPLLAQERGRGGGAGAPGRL
jgi:hypothetical protein